MGSLIRRDNLVYLNDLKKRSVQKTAISKSVSSRSVIL